MNKINALGLKVVGVTAIAIVLVWGSALAVRSLFPQQNTPSPNTAQSSTPSPQVAAGQAAEDSDSDGLADTLESIYGTDKTNADTDGDGTKDGDEVLLGRDPLTKGPNDTSNTEDGIISLGTFTEKYLATLPADAARDEVISRDRLEAFVEEHKGTLLPEVAADTIATTDDSSTDTIETYLNAISPTSNNAIAPVTNVDIEAAFQLSYAQGEPEAMENIIASLEHNIDTFNSLKVPEEVLPLHTKLVQATKGLLEAAKLLQAMPDDFVGGLIGAKKIEELAPVFEEIAADVTALEKKYDIE